MKKILIASPCRGGLSPSYVRSVIGLLNSSLCAGKNAQYKLDFAWTSGTSVAMARDELANLFLERGDDELISWDVDLGHPDPKVMLSMFARLLSHDVDIVGGAYVGHNFLSQWHGAAASDGEKMNENGLLKMAQIPLGFSKVKRRVFEKIKQDNPWLQYVFKETNMNKQRGGMTEFYPNGLVGPNTGQGKVDRIRKVLTSPNFIYEHPKTNLDRVIEIIDDDDYSQTVMLGEDFYFCRLAREAGFEMFIDNNLITPHESHVRLPVKNQDILAELSQEWRLSNDAKPEELKQLIELLTPHLSKDIP